MFTAKGYLSRFSIASSLSPELLNKAILESSYWLQKVLFLVQKGDGTAL